MNDPIAMLKRDHKEAAALLKELADSKPGAKRRRAARKLADALTLHMEIEERLVYPVVSQRVGEDEAQEAEIEHTLARDGVQKLLAFVDEPGFGAVVAMLTAGIKHHVKDEETEVFPQLKRQLERDELARIGDDVAAAKKPRRRSRAAA